MIDYLGGVPRRLDFGFVPSPSGGGLHAVQQEEIHNCYLVIQGYAPNLDSSDRVECPALVTAVGFTQLLFGYPNEEAYERDPRGVFEHGFFEIEDSGWVQSIDDYNRRSFGEPYRWSTPKRHFFIGSKDASCQVLANDLTVEVIRDQRFGEVVGMIPQRIHGYLHG
jgi:hypothetical protein